MSFATTYKPETQTRADVDATTGAVVIEFGTNWCSICQGTQGALREAFESFAAGVPDRVTHLKVEDGPGRALGRSFRVKLWPTLIFLRDGVEVERLVRPTRAAEVRTALERLTAAPAAGDAHARP